MASFNANIDLMSLKGAKLLSGIDQKHPERNFVCIPVDWSEIKVTENQQQGGFRANLRINLWPTSDKFRQACIDRRAQRGDDTADYNPPSHTIEVGYSQDFQKKAQAAAKARLLKEHPEWVDTDENFNKDLKNAIREAVRVRLGTVFTNVRKEQSQYTGTAPAAQGYTSWTPPQQAQPSDPFSSAYDDDEPPF